MGGGIANTFLKAAGYEVGKSLYEPDLVESAAKIMEEAKGRGAAIPLPVDVVVGPALEEHAPATVLKVEEVRPDDMILDIGPGHRRNVRPDHRRGGHRGLERSCGRV